MGNRLQAIETLKRALAAYDSVHYTKLQGVYSLLGRLYTQQSDYSPALRYELLALKSAEADRDTGMQLCAIYNYIGNIYNGLRQFATSIEYYHDAMEIAKKSNDNSTVIQLMVSISAGYSSLGQPEKTIAFLESIPKKYLQTTDAEEKVIMIVPYIRAYQATTTPEKAAPYSELLLKLLEDKGVGNGTKSTAYRTLAGYYLKIKSYSAARAQLLKYDAVTGSLGAFRISLGEQIWYKLDSSQGNFHDAFDHLNKYKTLNDSIFNATKARQLQQIQVEYETAKKEDSIRLKDKDIKLQATMLMQATHTRNWILGAVALLVVIVGLLVYNSRLKQRTNKKLQLQQAEISGQNNTLRHLVNEKEWLVKEIHHRIKNNLQTVMGLLGTQSGYLKNDIAINAISDSQRRIQSMSLIHQKLYQSNNLSAVKMTDYIHELVNSLSDSFDTDNRIRFKLEIEPVQLDLAHCIPLGLILNEAITNCFKYAFPGNQRGVISISLQHTFSNHFLLLIRDDGAGLPPGFDVSKSQSMGMNLMRGLSEEIGAEFILSGNNGTRIEINFVYTTEPAAGMVQMKTEAGHLV